MNFYVKLIIVLTLDVISALTARYSYNHDSDTFLVISMVSLAAAGYFFMLMLKEQVTIIANAIWIALGSMNVTIASYLVYGEVITVEQGIGMVIIIIGLITIQVYAPEEPSSLSTEVAQKMPSEL